jgi:hypothetical protein
LTVVEAIDRNERRGRCLECREPIRVHRAGRNGMAAHAEHLKRNPECRSVIGCDHCLNPHNAAPPLCQ